MAKKKATPQRVDFENNREDWTVVLMVCLGLSDHCIAKETGYTTGQVTYRVQKAGLQWERYNYRNGFSGMAEMVVENCGMSHDDAIDMVNATHGKKLTRKRRKVGLRKAA